MDIWLENDILPEQAQIELNAVVAPGLIIQSMKLVSLDLPPMQSLLKTATYEILFDKNDLNKQEVDISIHELLEKNTLNWEEVRGEKKRIYDLRATVIGLQLKTTKSKDVLIVMNLSMEEKTTGRPSQILKALNINVDPDSMVRTHIEMFPIKVN